MTHSQGAFARFLLEPGAAAGGPPPKHTFDASSLALEFLRESIQKRERFIGKQGIRGVLCMHENQIREGAHFIRGEVTTYLKPNDVDFLLLNVMGMSEGGGDVFTLQDSLPFFGALIDRDEGVFEYTDLKLDYWILRSRAPAFQEQGEPDLVYLTLGVIGTDEHTDTVWPGTPPTIDTTPLESDPYVFQDTTSAAGVSQIVLNGSPRACEEFIFIHRNFLKAKYTNALTPHSIRPRNRVVQARFRVPWNSTNADLYDLAIAGAAAQIKFTNTSGASVVDFDIDITNFKAASVSPVVSGKDQVSLIVDGFAYCDDSAFEYTITNDNTA